MLFMTKFINGLILILINLEEQLLLNKQKLLKEYSMNYWKMTNYGLYLSLISINMTKSYSLTSPGELE